MVEGILEGIKRKKRNRKERDKFPLFGCEENGREKITKRRISIGKIVATYYFILHGKIVMKI